MSKYKLGETVWLHDGMDLCGEVVSARPTIWGTRYTVHVKWTNGKYTNFSRIWWRVWS